jgi:hypothetical protein
VFLFERLHAAVLERYGEEACRTFLEGFQGESLEFETVSVTGPAPWDWETDGQSTTIEEAWTVVVDQVSDGEESRREIHLALAEEGEVAWFTDCGVPLLA